MLPLCNAETSPAKISLTLFVVAVSSSSSNNSISMCLVMSGWSKRVIQAEEDLPDGRKRLDFQLSCSTPRGRRTLFPCRIGPSFDLRRQERKLKLIHIYCRVMPYQRYLLFPGPGLGSCEFVIRFTLYPKFLPRAAAKGAFSRRRRRRRRCRHYCRRLILGLDKIKSYHHPSVWLKDKSWGWLNFLTQIEYPSEHTCVKINTALTGMLAVHDSVQRAAFALLCLVQ